MKEDVNRILQKAIDVLICCFDNVDEVVDMELFERFVGMYSIVFYDECPFYTQKAKIPKDQKKPSKEPKEMIYAIDIVRFHFFTHRRKAIGNLPKRIASIS